jgi:hypothetical protein
MSFDPLDWQVDKLALQPAWVRTLYITRYVYVDVNSLVCW